LGFGDTAEYARYAKQCADWLHWKFEKLDGDACLIRRLVNGDWNGEDFLVVQPGYKIAATHDETIMKAVPA
jgi:hypothetical protein